MIRFGPASLRTRLTLWYLAVFGSILAIYIAGTSAFVYLGLRESLDDELVEDIERIEPLAQFTPDGQFRMNSTAQGPADPDRPQEPYIEVLLPDGRILYRSGTLGEARIDAAPFEGEGKGSYSERSSRLPDGTSIRVASRLHRVGDRQILIRVARAEEPLWREFKEVLSVLVLGLPAALALAGLAGYGFARRLLAPLGAMAKRAGQITAERLQERLPVENPADELGQLALVFNDTLTRLESSFEQLRRFTADASHELRTPLTAIRSVGEVGLQRGGTVADYREVIGSMLEETNRLTRMVESLLTLSRADAGTVQLQRAPLCLLSLAKDAAGLLAVLAEEKHQILSVEGDGTATVSGDPLFLRQAVLNIIDNAIKYSPAGGKVSVKVRREENSAVLEVADNGPGIALEHRNHVFERFYRLDRARSREAGGAGLGLAITRWAVQAHGGSISIDSSEEEGATFRITLPLTGEQNIGNRRAAAGANGRDLRSRMK